jgi:hypothetical protein
VASLLLDFRRNVSQILTDPEFMFAVRDFLNLVRTTYAPAARFIEADEEAAIYEHNPIAVRRAAWPTLNLFLQHCRRAADSPCLAQIDGQPGNVRDSWRRGLRDELSTPADWQRPQIVVLHSVRHEWPPNDEVAVRLAACQGTAASGPFDRVLATLEGYDAHRFAASDLDPWRNLEYLYRPNAGQKPHPCRLPRPPSFEGVPLGELHDRIDEAHRLSWYVNGRYYFIPPRRWRPERVTKERWRDGYAFDQQPVQGMRGPSPVDSEGRIWLWDLNERHWDVQIIPRKSISHSGLLLKETP